VDYIIFGIGAGSSLVLIGWLLRDWGPALRDRTSRASNDVLTARQLIDQMRWARFCGSCGTALAIGGSLVLLVTICAMLVSPSDARGATIVLAAFAIAAIAMLVWSWLFVSRFGIEGIIRRKPASVTAVTSPVNGDYLDEAHDDFGFSPGTTVPESRTPEPAVHPDIGSIIPDRLAAPGVVEETRASDDAPDQTPAADQPQPEVSPDDDVTPVEETTGKDGSEPERDVTTGKVDDERAAAESSVNEMANEVLLEDDATIPVDQEEAGSGERIGDERDGIAAAAISPEETEGADQVASVQDTADVGVHPDESAGETADPKSGREEALRNLRERRRGRLTRNQS